ncbi:Rieske (2Fe-2S) protein [Marinimicrobium sp. ABcell2]|uniref:Rieske (2Fe-2S) protein n=1 Tax=Marinimicrobium sp. ABcell2 TaxID=3069751 RepID=UPI0027B4F967|nr:Rieske (2Fe-2S) protein [Marinimicrobium sp. ABcell2]MDQ2077909.1 Rieske (2Fe-2S) protein [Marinimicrobium sp. ABcell2]
MAYQALEKLHQLYDGYLNRIRLGGRDLLLVQEEGKVYLLANRCPHMDAPLHKASVRAGILRCPVHGIEFDLLTGRALGPAAECVGPLQSLPLVYEGNTVGVDV